MSRRRRHRLLPHTADLRVEVRAGSLPDLYASCVEAFFSLVADRRLARPREERRFHVAAASPGEILFLALRETLLLFEVGRFVGRSARATTFPGGVEIVVAGEPADPRRHRMFREIKAVTAHALAVEEGPGGVRARFVVDV